MFGLIFFRVVWHLVQPAVLHVGMDFDKAQSILANQRAEQAGFDVMLLHEAQKAPADRRQLHHYWLQTGRAIAIISKPAPDGQVIESISVSTHAPKSWEGKGDPERDKFFASFVEVKEYDLMAKSADCGGVLSDDRVMPGGREKAAERATREQFTIECVFYGAQILAAILGLVAGVTVAETLVGIIRRILWFAVAMFVLEAILLCWLRRDSGGGVMEALSLSAFLFMSYATVALFLLPSGYSSARIAGRRDTRWHALHWCQLLSFLWSEPHEGWNNRACISAPNRAVLGRSLCVVT